MKNHLLLKLVVCILPLLFTSCCKNNNDIDIAKVTAAFTSVTEAEKGTTIVFTNNSENASYYQWNLGDETLSFDESPSHTYNLPGIYDVSLVAIGSSGSDTAFARITINNYKNISIYEGVGIEGTNLYDTWTDINSRYFLDTIYFTEFYPDYNIYHNAVYYRYAGIVFQFFTSSSKLSSQDEVYIISLVSPYPGATEQNIKIGSGLTDMLTAFGNPEDYYTGNGYVIYYYNTKGICFYTVDDSHIAQIDVYAPSTSKSVSMNAIPIKKITSTIKNLTLMP